MLPGLCALDLAVFVLTCPDKVLVCRAVRPLIVVIAAYSLTMGIYAEVAGNSMTASRRLVLIVPCSKVL